MGFKSASGGGGGGGGITDHNGLTNLQGGIPGQNYHFSQTDYTKVQNIINPYLVPSVGANPNSFGANTLEVGDNLVLNNQNIALSYQNAQNIYQNKVNIDGADFPLPKASFLLNLTTNHNTRGNKTLSTIGIQRSDNQNWLYASVSGTWEYKIFSFLHNADDNLITNYSVAGLIALIKAKPGALRANKAIGTVRFTPVGNQHIYVAYPVSYGQVELATPTFPNNNVARSNRDFIYTNNGVNTNYRLTKMDDYIGGVYDCLIK